jgi:hypothetical protein
VLLVKPVLQALLVADRIYVDKGTGKHVIAGVFNRMIVGKATDIIQKASEGDQKRFVAGGLHSGSPYAYANLTGVHGKQELVLRYVYLNEDQPIFGANFTVHCDDPLASVEIVFPLPPLPAAKAGTYALELLCNDEPVGAFRIRVEELQVEGASDDDNS